MKYLILEKSEFGGYSNKNIIEPANLALIFMFLEDVRINYDYFIKLLESNYDDSISTNCCYLFKRSEIAIVGFLYAEDDQELEATLPVRQLIKLIKKWKVQEKVEVEYIVITQEDETYDLIGGNQEFLRNFLGN
jgi:hypothetical protein